MSLNDDAKELTRIREQLGLSVRKFAERVKEPEARYKNYEYGITKKVPERVLLKAKALLRSPAAAEVAHEDDERIKRGFAITVAVRAWESALAGMDPNEESYFDIVESPYEIPTAFLVGGIQNADRHDLVKVSGRSMSPLIEPGDRVLFFQDSSPRRNTVVMVESPEHKVYIKVIRDTGAHWILESINPEGQTFEDLRGWKICGYAVAIMRDPEGSEMNIHWPFGMPIKAPT
jgi:phage repressor protein C with HTH and peptisase S24 domain